MSLIQSMRDAGRPVAYYPRLARFFGSVNASIFFSQLAYWQDRTNNPLGTYKTTEEWEEETGLSYREQVTARKHLATHGFLVETHKRLEHRVFYRLNFDTIDVAFGEWTKRHFPNCGMRNSPNDENAFREQRIPQSVSKTETPTETPTEILPEAPSAPAAPAPSDAPAVVAFRVEPVIAKPVFPAIDEAVEVEVAEVLPAVKAAAAKPARVRKPKVADNACAIPADETALQAACKAAWGAYSAAYDVRYGALPVRNAKVNAAVKGIVQRLGAEEAPAVASFFVSNVNDAFVVRACHDIGLLLKSAEGYRTQWATGTAVTQTRARQADQSAANYDAAAEALALLRARRAARAAQAQQEGA